MRGEGGSDRSADEGDTKPGSHGLVNRAREPPVRRMSSDLVVLAPTDWKFCDPSLLPSRALPVVPPAVFRTR